MQKPKSAKKFTLIIPALESLHKVAKPSSVKKELLSSPTFYRKDPDFEEIDISTINSMIEKLWAKFILYYNLEETFQYDKQYTNDQSVRKMKGSKDNFELKLRIYFEIYNIKKDENQCLVSHNKEGSYILQNYKIWIIHLKILKENYKYKLIDLFPLFKRALEHNVNYKMLFDFFISLLIESDELEEIIAKLSGDATDKNSNDCGVPIQFISLWEKNKDHILSEIKKELYKKDTKEKEEEEKKGRVSNQININNSIVNEEEEFSFRVEQNNKKIEKPKNNKEVDKTKQTHIKKKRDFYRNFNASTDLKDAIIIEDEKIRKSANFAVLELDQKIQENTGHKYVITPIKEKINRKEATEDLKSINQSFSDILYQPYNEQIASKINNHKEKECNE